MENGEWEIVCGNSPILDFPFWIFRPVFALRFSRFLASYSATFFSGYPPLYTKLFNAFLLSHRVAVTGT